MNSKVMELLEVFKEELGKQLTLEETLGYLPDEEEHCLDLVEIAFNIFDELEIQEDNIPEAEYFFKIAVTTVCFCRDISIKKFLDRFEIDDDIERCGKRIQKLMEKENFKLERCMDGKAILFLSIFENHKSMNFMNKSMELIEILKENKASQLDIKDFLYHK